MKMQVIMIDQARAQGSTWHQISSIAAFHRRAALLLKSNRAMKNRYSEHLRLVDYFDQMAAMLKTAR
jgi:hypothetical protein